MISIVILIFKGLNYGIDFSGGNLIQVKYEEKITLKDINSSLDKIAKEVTQLSSIVEKYRYQRTILLSSEARS